MVLLQSLSVYDPAVQYTSLPPSFGLDLDTIDTSSPVPGPASAQSESPGSIPKRTSPCHTSRL